MTVPSDLRALSEQMLGYGHHADCSSRRGGECDCYYSTSVDFLLAHGVRALLDERDRLQAVADALDRVLRWPLPQGTVEEYALPPWLSREARDALAALGEQQEPAQ